MIFSTNKTPELRDFEHLVYAANDFLNRDARENPDYYKTRRAQKLEDDVFSALNKLAEGTAFEGTIQKISGQKFPDIIAADYFGVEVKSSYSNNWETLGGSVNESTRVDGIERIFLIFGKLLEPVEFRARPYEECLSEVVVTHYPRYKIDMNLEEGNTIFDKMRTTYDELRASENPVHKIVEYYRSNLKKGEALWWIDGGDNPIFDNSYTAAGNIKVRLWRTLSGEEKKSLVNAGFAFFPQLLGDSHDKYEAFSLWLVARFGIVSTSLRDSFSAGGQETISLRDGEHTVSQAKHKVYQNRSDIIRIINSADEPFLRSSWNVGHIASDRIGQWIDIVSSFSGNPEDERRLFKLLLFPG